MKRFLILQLRPETDAADGEFAAILDKCALDVDRVHRVRLDQQDLPKGLNVTDYAGVIVGGGPGCVSDAAEDKSQTEARMEAQIMDLMPQITESDHPFMGCCYGLAILAAHLGGDVSKAQYGEDVGPISIETVPASDDDPLTKGLPDQFEVFVGHKEAVQSLPRGCVHLLSSAPCPFQMIRYGQNVYATQFHPEAEALDFERRIRIYRNHGYFPPDQAEALIEICHRAGVTVPREILRRFVARYG